MMIMNEKEEEEGCILFLAIILDACWRSDDELTLVDNCNRILHIALNSVITNPTSSFLSSSSSSSSLLSSSSSHAIQIMAGHEQEITSVCWNLDRSVLLSSSEDGTIKVGEGDDDDDDSQ